MIVPFGNGSFPCRWALTFIVAQNGADIVEVAFFAGHGDQPPVAVSGEILVTKIGAASSSAHGDAGVVKATTPARISPA
jgi:hypothetical protein